MSNPTNANDRDAAVRALLVETVAHTPRRRRRWRLPTIAGAVVCVLGGAAAGGAITAAANPEPAAIAAQNRAVFVVGGAGTTYQEVVGTPVGRVGSSEETITVGPAPKGADTFTWVATCRTGGALTEWRSGVAWGPSTCEAGSTTSNSYSAKAIAGREIRLSADRNLGWTLSYGWLRTPPMPEASAAQDEAMDDGIVTRSEYLAAFDRFQGCLTARGESLGRIPTSSLFVAYGVSDAYALDWCTASEFDAVDTAWQGEHPAPAGADEGTWGWQRYDPAADPRYAG